MLKNKCSVWKRIKFPTFWYNCYYFTWSDTYFIQLETLLINHPSYFTTFRRNVNSTAVHEFETTHSEEIFSSPNIFRTALQWILGFRIELKRPEHDVDQTPPGSAEVETEWSYTSSSCMFLSGTYETNFSSTWPVQSYVWLAPDFLMPDCNKQIHCHSATSNLCSFYSPDFFLLLFRGATALLGPWLFQSSASSHFYLLPPTFSSSAFQRVLSLPVHFI